MIESPVIAKLLGVLAGTSLALVFNPPRTRRGFAQRTFVAFVFGSVFGPIIAWHFNLPDTTESVIAANATSAFISWWALGAVKAAAEKIGAKDK